jgi:hypothetical protein
MKISDSDDEEYNPVEAEQIIDHNAQSTIVLLVSLCREEYRKVNSMERDKDIWDTLKAAHEDDKITKIELLEGDLERFHMLKREETQEMYN